MTLTADSAKNISIGAGMVYVDDAPVGATEDNNLFTAQRTIFSPKINGVAGKVKGLDYIQEEMAELQVSVAELSPDKLEYSMPGGITIPGDAQGTAAGGGENTTLAAASNIGDTNLKMTDVAALAPGDIIMAGTAGNREFRTVKAVGTAGAGGSGVDVLGPLLLAHGNGDPVIEVVSTTLAVDTPVAIKNLKLAQIPASLVAGSYVRFGYPGEMEVRLVTFVGTAGAGGTGISFGVPTLYPHRAGDFLVVQTNAGSSMFGSQAGQSRRIPDSAYHKWELRVPGVAGREWRFTVFNALNIDPANFEGQDAGTMKPRLKLQARWDPANDTATPWGITPIVAS